LRIREPVISVFKERAALHVRQQLKKAKRPLEKIESLPAHQQAVLLKTIDTFIKAAGK
jgi:hypothetical protein